MNNKMVFRLAAAALLLSGMANAAFSGREGHFSSKDIEKQTVRLVSAGAIISGWTYNLHRAGFLGEIFGTQLGSKEQIQADQGRFARDIGGVLALCGIRVLRGNYDAAIKTPIHAGLGGSLNLIGKLATCWGQTEKIGQAVQNSNMMTAAPLLIMGLQLMNEHGIAFDGGTFARNAFYN